MNEKRQDLNNMRTIQWTVAVAGTLLSLLAGVFLVGWNVRGQTAQIKAVEVETKYLKTEFDDHCVAQVRESSKVNQKLSDLEKNEAAQTVILQNINDKLK